jgi:hypothetical protein
VKRQELRALRAIEKNLEADDPQLAEQLRSFGGVAGRRRYWIAGSVAAFLFLIGISSGDGALLLSSLFLGFGAFVDWMVRAAG